MLVCAAYYVGCLGEGKVSGKGVGVGAVMASVNTD